MKYILLLLLVLISVCSFAQKSKHEVVITKENKYIDSLIKKAKKYRLSGNDSCIYLCEKILNISKKEKYRHGEAMALHLMGTYYVDNSQPQKAEKMLKKAIAFERKYHLKNELAISLRNYSFILMRQNRSPIPFILEACQLFEGMTVKEQKELHYSNTLITLSEYYLRNNDMDKCYYYAKKTHDLTKENDINSNDLIQALIHISDVLFIKKKYNEALINNRKILYLTPTLNSNLVANNDEFILLQIAEVYNRISNIYFDLNTRDSAKIYKIKTIAISRKIKNNYLLSLSCNYMARIYMNEDSLSKSLSFITEAIAASKTLNDAELMLIDYGLLAELHTKMKNHEQAFKALIKYISLSDSLSKLKNNREMGKLEANFEYNQKEQALLQKQKIQALENSQLAKDKLLISAENETQKLLNEQSFQRNKILTLENENQKKIRVQQQQLFEAERKQIETKKQQELAQQRLYIYLLIIGFSVLILVAHLIWRNGRQKQKANQLLQLKNEEVEQKTREITAQAQQLELANGTKDLLFSIIAHDLRSPIVAFEGLTAQIDFFLQKNKPERVLELKGMIEKSTHSLKNFLDNLLRWALMQNQSLVLDIQTIDLQELTEELILLYAPIAQSHVIQLENRISPSQILATDRDVLSTILRNLIANALKFTPENGKVSVYFQETDSYTSIYVQDTGVGIAPEKLDSIFLLYSQKSSKGLHGEKGIGLGLLVCNDFAQRLGAKLSVQSELGKGTTFSLQFPRV